MKRISACVYETANTGVFVVRASLAGNKYHKGGFQTVESATDHADYLHKLSASGRQAEWRRHKQEKISYYRISQHVSKHIFIAESGKYSVRYRHCPSGVTYMASGISTLVEAEAARAKILAVTAKPMEENHVSP